MRDARRRRRLRRQGAEPQQPGPELLAEAGDRRRCEGHRIRNVIDRVVDVEYTITDSVSEALLLEANLIKRYRPRFNVRLKDDKSYPYIKITHGRRLPAGRADAEARRGRQPVLRAVCVGELGRRVDEPRPAALPVPDLHDRHQGWRAGAGPAVPAVPHQALPGPLHRGRLEGRLRRADRPDRAVPRGPPGDRWSKALTTEMQVASEQTDYERAAAVRDKIRAIERTMESQKMAAFKRTELDLVGLARQDNQAAIQLFAIRDGSDGRARRVPARRRPRGARRGGPLELPRAVLRARDVDPAAGARAVRAAGRGGPRGVPGRAARRAGPPAGPAARREAGADGPRDAERGRDARPRAGPLAGRPGQDARRPSRSWPRRSGCPGRRSGSSATTSRTSRAPIRSAAMVVFEEGRPRTGRVPPVQDPDGRRRERLRLAPGGAAAPVPPGAGRATRAAEEALRWAMPDLVIIDGGKGQVSAAKEVLDELGLHDLPMAGLAKEREELFLPGRPSRSSCRRRRPRCTSSSGCATRPTASRSPTTATCARSARPAPRSTTCRASARSAGGRCCGSSARRSGSARRRSSRSRRCPGSAPSLAARIKESLGA